MTAQAIDDPDLTLRELFDRWPAAMDVFMRHRMLCVGCVISSFHTLVDACAEYRLDEDEFRAEIRKAIAEGVDSAGVRAREQGLGPMRYSPDPPRRTS